MTEPTTTAERAEQILPGLWRWAIHDQRIDFVGASYAVASDEGTVLVDPHPLADEALAELRPVTAIVLSCGSHQRCAWRYRRELGAPVWAPALARQIDEEPDERYGDGDRLPGGLLAVFTPGAGTTQHTLLIEGEPRVAICPDLLLQPEGGELDLVPDRYLHDPALARESVARLLELPFDVLCLTHGPVLADDPKGAIRHVLAHANAR